MMPYISCPFVSAGTDYLAMAPVPPPQGAMPQGVMPQGVMPQGIMPQGIMPQGAMPQETQPMAQPYMQPTMQNMPGAPVMQNMPEVPMMPMMQNMPGAPVMQNMPGAPMMPMMQNMPGTPAMPTMQNMSGIPMMQNWPMQGYGMQPEPFEYYPMSGMGTPDDTQRQPQPIITNPPATTSITLFKELTGYRNYGNPSGNADILYTGNRGVWTFEVPGYLFAGNQRAQIVIRAVLDDHYTVPANRYSATITVNGTIVHQGRLPLEHGVPAGGRFTNWRSLTFNVRNLRRNNRVVIENTSSTGENDWIAFDWMELRITPR